MNVRRKEGCYSGWDQGLWSQTDLGSNPSSTSYLLCDLGQVTQPLYAFLYNKDNSACLNRIVVKTK